MTNILVGAAKADITPAVGCLMGGYGARKGRASSIADPLYCRAFVFDDGTSTIALAVCDLVYVTYDISSGARQFIADELGIPPSAVMIAGTHTHSGPVGVTMGLDPVFTEMVRRKVAGAVVEAYRARRPAFMKYAEATVTTVSQNRRDPEGPIETTARVLIAESKDPEPKEAGPVATIVNYACHPTVLEHDNLALSPDFPGALVRSVEENVGGQAAFLQGCAGAINPVWMRHDHPEAKRVGSILGLAAARAVQEAAPLGRGQWSVNLSLAQDVPKPGPEGTRLVPEGGLGGSSVKVRLTRRERQAPADLEAQLLQVEAALSQAGAPGQRKALLARRAALVMEHHFALEPYPYYVRDGKPQDQSSDDYEVEVQALRLGVDTVIVGLPGEPFLEIANEIRRRSQVPNLVVAGYANEAIGYLPWLSEFAFDGYEVGCAHFTPDAAESLAEGALLAISACEEQASQDKQRPGADD